MNITRGRTNITRANRTRGIEIPTAAWLGLTSVAVLAAAAWIASRPRPGALEVRDAVTVLRTPDELYGKWRDLAHLPDLMPHLESVTPLDGRRSRWVARGPAGVPVEWDAELIADDPGRLIAWQSIGGDIDTTGRVEFRPAPGNRGTEIAVHLIYAPPAGRLGSAVATLLGRGVGREVREDLRRFKQSMEAREVATSGRD